MTILKCRFCSREYAWSKNFICSKCEHKLDGLLYRNALDIKSPKIADYWADRFKADYTKDEIIESFWRLVGDRKMYLTDDRKMGVRK